MGANEEKARKFEALPSKTRVMLVALAILENLTEPMDSVAKEKHNKRGERYDDSGMFALSLFRLILNGLLAPSIGKIGYLAAPIRLIESQRIALLSKFFSFDVTDKNSSLKNYGKHMAGLVSQEYHSGDYFNDYQKTIMSYSVQDFSNKKKTGMLPNMQGSRHAFRKSIRPEYWESTQWSFWRDWYQGFLDGKPLDWELQRRVALIPDEDWDKGPAHIAEKIEEIKADFYAEKLPQAEVLKPDPETGKYFVAPTPFDPEAMVEGLLKQVEFALEMAISSNVSGFNRMCTAHKYLSHTLENCRDDPNVIEQHFGLARKIIENKLSSGEYQQDDGLTALTLSLERHEVQLRGDHPKVRKAWEVRVEQEMREIDEAKRLALASRFDDMREDTQDRLNSEFGLDAETMRSGAGAKATADAVKRSGGRSAKIAVLEKASAVAKRVDGSGLNKATGIMLRAQKVLDILQTLF